MTKRIAVVTGGMGGIGTAICRELGNLDIKVIAAYSREHEAALAWQKKETELGQHFDIGYVNVTDFKSCEAFANKIKNEVGSIAILVNNAGITRDHSCCNMSKEEWDVVINTDLNSVFYMTHALLPEIKQQPAGRIINISSINGQKGQYGQVNYSAAKAGMHGFTKALAREVAMQHTTVNTVSPGYVATDMVLNLPKNIQEKILADIPMGRFAEPEEVARVVAFLADEKNSYITGANIAINGGHYMA